MEFTHPMALGKGYLSYDFFSPDNLIGCNMRSNQMSKYSNLISREYLISTHLSYKNLILY